MMKKKTIDKQGLISELNLVTTGKDWYTNKKLECPECGKDGGKFGIKIKSDDTGLVNCWKCGYSDSVFNFLFRVNKYHLVNSSKKYEYQDELTNVFAKQAEKVVAPTTLPKGFKRIQHHDYLESRGVRPYQYDQFEIGITNSVYELSWHNKLIFKIINNGVCVEYLGRSTKSKEWHDQNLIDNKEGKCRLDIRYKNSDGDFNFVLGGLDDITTSTNTVLIVEGIFDKMNIDNLIDVQTQTFMRCVFTFGSSISDHQITLLKSKRQVTNIILLYDLDALKKMRQYVYLLMSTFHEVHIGVILDKDVDPGNMNIQQLSDVFGNLKTPDQFYSGILINKAINYE